MHLKKKIKLGSKEGGSRKHERTVQRVELHLSFTVPTDAGVTVPQNCEPFIKQPDRAGRVGGRNDEADRDLAAGSIGGQQDGRTASSSDGVGGGGDAAGGSASSGRLAGGGTSSGGDSADDSSDSGWSLGVKSSIWSPTPIVTNASNKPTEVRA